MSRSYSTFAIIAAADGSFGRYHVSLGKTERLKDSGIVPLIECVADGESVATKPLVN